MVISKAQQARNNKNAGAKFEGEVRKALDNLGQFVYVKGVSTKGIDILGLKDNKVLFIELKSHAVLKNYQYKEAFSQLTANKVIVDNMIDRTVYTEHDVTYILVYYIRNESLIIENLKGNKVIFEKTRKTNMVDFVENSLIEFMK